MITLINIFHKEITKTEVIIIVNFFIKKLIKYTNIQIQLHTLIKIK
jgi:hypothetical protein